MRKLMVGIGFDSGGKYKITENSKHTHVYTIWNQLFQRVYQNKYRVYEDVLIDSIWHDFQNFANWYETNKIENFVIDKDILFKGNKIYSPETCCFVPQEINNLFCKSNIIRGKFPIGIVFDKSRNKYRAQIKKYGKQINLGRFITIEEAFQTYKIAKEAYIKEVADKWKDKISEKIYLAMYNYQVEITD